MLNHCNLPICCQLYIICTPGNDGADQGQEAHNYGTVNSPASCKNVLTVGATESWVSGACW
jgi:hypothetical protein